ncbi:iron transport protein (plasmid) [Haloferax mediterranei ATCC 33500]|uniref:Iron transport protein n=1 Tax=Haloferax mediterranei (strain ATCC 33500 / DSM 1411 / JCM 8866 / NBRC 14739 / NCIMB 2177 / R-4) TaxID=523841 RepID=I3RAG9_HALMT|nr:hypothetical protein [Haloferax mediterranei]AFK21229.1 putative iron transport protein [Haloferax mediterranei ATCC 33500]AHZ24667.1 iron transport protein [Haloferax mediterranei ATCC 33500]ELZ97442.1 putative iron transport protein [Haloferax mediterranei ATCC 33500]MDX5990268.1 iron transport protein [Haloferax mediterranei ATCC 33500]QCQ77063.1 iron transport protein [Haloferax mediterranei ATCC 33500]
MTDANGGDTTDTPTHKEYVKYSGALVGGGLLTDCTGGSGSTETAASTVTSGD